MRSREKRCSIVFAVLLPLTAMVPDASAEGIIRSNWIPNVGQLNTPGEQPLGDLWTFRCPRGGTVTIVVDTKDDTDTPDLDSRSDIEPVFMVVDGAGNLLVFAHGETGCAYPPVCDANCPLVNELACGSDGKHSIIVRDFGVTTAATPCQEGGGYNLHVEVFGPDGRSLPSRIVDLGGGPRRQVPGWALDLEKAPVGPALDDEDVPLFQEE
jgi:hypothetical protein